MILVAFRWNISSEVREDLKPLWNDLGRLYSDNLHPFQIPFKFDQIPYVVSSLNLLQHSTFNAGWYCKENYKIWLVIYTMTKTNWLSSVLILIDFIFGNNIWLNGAKTFNLWIRWHRNSFKASFEMQLQSWLQ